LNFSVAINKYAIRKTSIANCICMRPLYLKGIFKVD
jgi:hypothetical protein